jgi:predicted nucleotidyltransferase
MTETSEASDVITALEESLRENEVIQFAVVFGSQVSGETTEGSDLDLTVKFAEYLSANERFSERCVLSGTLQQDDWPFVDVSDIETLPLDVAHDAVDGQFVCGDKQAFETFKREVETDFAEQREELRTYQRSVIDRIAEEGLRG